jgi:AraC family transcriptional regulator
MPQISRRSADCQRIVEAQLCIGLGEVALISEVFQGPIDGIGIGPRHHLQMALSPAPRNAYACFPDSWGPHRFEHIGELFMAPAGCSFHARSDCRMQKSITCEIDPERATLWFESSLDWTKTRLAGSLDIKHGEIRRRLFRIAAELQQPGFGSEVLVESIAAQIGIELIRYFQGIDSAPCIGGLPPWRLRLIDDALAHDPGAASLASLAGLAGLSVRHLTRAFRASRGISLAEQIALSRLELARRMLSDGASIKATAASAGFSAPTNFSAAFRRATGFSPREYRERSGRLPH